MSLYCEIKTQFKNRAALVAALVETGNWTKEQIELHDQPEHLFGVEGKARQERAHVIIRRQHVGGISNDIGFLKTETGEYEAIISSYDRGRYNDKWLATLRGNYAFYVIEQQQRMRGRQVTRTKLANGRQRIAVNGYR
jgi:hypothetical protein